MTFVRNVIGEVADSRLTVVSNAALIFDLITVRMSARAKSVAAL
jgi:hypothetical protein